MTVVSGRLLYTTSLILGGVSHYYFGIDIDLVCAKMTIINLFLNGVFHFEVMQADVLSAELVMMKEQL